jgi:hypothetical protein
MSHASPGNRTGRAQRGCRALAAFVFVSLLSIMGGTPWLGPATAADAAAVASEERVKAAYLHKFLNYAEWPPAVLARADAPYVIGLAGDDAVADELARIAAGRTVNNRGVIVKRVLPGESLGDLHMLFLGRGERARQAQWLRQAKGRPILTVTDADGALDQGSMINFRILEDRVRFEVSVDAAEQAGLRLSSRLFAIATNVVKGSHQP